MANPPHVADGKQAVKLLHCAKAPRCNGIPPEVFKNRPLALKRRLLRLSLNIWESETLPKNWRPSSCHSSSGRTPSQTAVLTENLSYPLPARCFPICSWWDWCPPLRKAESQIDFWPDTGTTSITFAGNQIQEQCWEHQKIILLRIWKPFSFTHTVDPKISYFVKYMWIVRIPPLCLRGISCVRCEFLSS